MPKLIKEYSYNFQQLYMPTWVSTAYRCENGSTGYEERQVVDVNPLNNPPTPSHWERNSPSIACNPPPCDLYDENQPRMLYDINNDGILDCVDAELVGQPECESCYANGRPGTQMKSTWQQADGRTVITYTDCTNTICDVQKGTKKKHPVHTVLKNPKK